VAEKQLAKRKCREMTGNEWSKRKTIKRERIKEERCDKILNIGLAHNLTIISVR
jgi:hypothetical protein